MNRRNRKGILIIPLIAFLLLVSCNSFERNHRKTPELRGVLLEDIEVLLKEGLAVDALQDIDFLYREGRIEEGEKERFQERAITDILGAFQENVASEDYYDAYRRYLALVALSQQDMVSEWTAGRLLSLLANNIEDQEDKLSALSIRMRILDLLPPEEVDATLVLARDTGNAAALRIIMEKARELGLDVAPEITDMAESRPSKAEMQAGMVTVWVDKGIRVERGIGYPDRVLGSGFFIDPRGYLITNYHVIESEVDPEYEGYSRLYVRMSGKPDEKVPAKVVGWDRAFDLALIKVEMEPRFVFTSAGDVQVEPGEMIFAIGSPLDPFLENTITSGIVSAIGRRQLLQMGDVIQIDAPVNPGNSGGPLLNQEGELAGVVFAGFQPYQGLNFAIPIVWLNKTLPRLFQEGEVIHPWLGMALIETEKGLEIIYTVPGEPAMRGGLEVGDILVSVNSRRFTSIRDLQSFLVDFPAQTLLRLEWTHGTQLFSGLFMLQDRPHSPVELALERDRRINLLLPLFGMELKKTGNFLWETNYAVQRVLPGSIADNTGLSVDDPVMVQDWQIDEENRFAVLQLFVKKKKAGFLESVVRLLAYMELDSFV